MFKHNTYPVDSMPCGGLWRDEMHSVRPDCPRWWTTADQSQRWSNFLDPDTFFPSCWRFFSENSVKKTKKSGLMGKMPGISSSRGIQLTTIPPPRPGTHGVVHWDEYNTFHHATTHHTALDSPYTSSVATFNLRIINEGDYRCSKLCFPQHKKWSLNRLWSLAIRCSKYSDSMHLL